MILRDDELAVMDVPTQPAAVEYVFRNMGEAVEVDPAGVRANEVVSDVFASAILPPTANPAEQVPVSAYDREKFFVGDGKGEVVGIAHFDGGSVQTIIALTQAFANKEGDKFKPEAAAQVVANSLLESGAELATSVPSVTDRSQIERAMVYAITEAQPAVPRTKFNERMGNGLSALLCAVGKEKADGDTFVYLGGVGIGQVILITEMPNSEVAVQHLYAPQDMFYYIASLSSGFWDLPMPQKQQKRAEAMAEQIKVWGLDAPARVLENQRKIAHSLNDQQKLPEADSTRFNITRSYPPGSHSTLVVASSILGNLITPEVLQVVKESRDDSSAVARALKTAAEKSGSTGTFMVAAVAH